MAKEYKLRQTGDEVQAILDQVGAQGEALSGLESRMSAVETAASGKTGSAERVTWAALKAKRDGQSLVAGQWYRVTDYVATVGMKLYTNDPESAGHAFDVLVMATSEGSLSEDALAVKHDGDTYFDGCNLSGWRLRYSLDNVEWSRRSGTYVQAGSYGAMPLMWEQVGTVAVSGQEKVLWWNYRKEDNGYPTEYAISDGVGYDAYLVGFDMQTMQPSGAEVGGVEDIETIPTGGTGVVLWLKDEYGNEAGYDFKSLQWKRWKMSDGRYAAVLGHEPEPVVISDEQDYKWMYLFSQMTDGVVTDGSLTGVAKGVRFAGYTNNVCYGGTDSYFGAGFKWNTLTGTVAQVAATGRCEGNVFAQVSDCLLSGYAWKNLFNDVLLHCSLCCEVAKSSFRRLQNCRFGGTVVDSTFGSDAIDCDFQGGVIGVRMQSELGVAGVMKYVQTFGDLDETSVTVPNFSSAATFVALTDDEHLKIWNPAG